MPPVWHPEEHDYLRQLMASCETLAQRFKTEHDRVKTLQSQLRIPVIVLSTLAGTASFGSGTFHGSMQMAVGIGVGLVNLAIAIGNAVEAYLKWGNVISTCIKASLDLQKLKEKIYLEQQLPIEGRETNGVIMTRNSYVKYESIMSASPAILKKVRFIHGASTQESVTCGESVKILISPSNSRTPPSTPSVLDVPSEYKSHVIVKCRGRKHQSQPKSRTLAIPRGVCLRRTRSLNGIGTRHRHV